MFNNRIQKGLGSSWMAVLTGRSGNSTSSEKIKNLQSSILDFRLEFGPSKKDILNFTNQLSVMVRAGMNLTDSLESIGSQNDGQSFSQALSRHCEVFGNFYINMVSAAEVSGSLASMLEKLAEYLDAEAETRSQIKSAMVYPIIIAYYYCGDGNISDNFSAVFCIAEIYGHIHW
jgi:type II secretory pathway component PulF